MKLGNIMEFMSYMLSKKAKRDKKIRHLCYKYNRVLLRYFGIRLNPLWFGVRRSFIDEPFIPVWSPQSGVCDDFNDFKIMKHISGVMATTNLYKPFNLSGGV